MTEEEKKELKEEIALAAGIDPKLMEAMNRIYGDKLNAAEKVYVEEMNKLAKDLAKKTDIEYESKLKARIFDDHWMQRIEEHLERHLPVMIDGRKVVVHFPGAQEVLEGVVDEIDAGYIVILDCNSKRFVVSWSAGPVFEILPESSAATPPEKVAK